MKGAVHLLLLLLSCMAFGQSKPKDRIDEIANSDTLTFTTHSSGCFHSYTHVYTIVAQKDKTHQVLYKNDSLLVAKTLSEKAYRAFVSDFKKSFHHFTDHMVAGGCTTVTTFELKGHAAFAKFKNDNCKAEFEPERFLKTLLE